MSIVKQLDRRSGITYAYESVSHWDKEKKQSRSVRKLIGRVDEKTGEIIATDGRRKKEQAVDGQIVAIKRGRVPSLSVKRQFYGATYLLDKIGEKVGITDDLKTCFPKNYKMILSIAYFLILEESNPLFRFGRWERLHRHPYGGDIASQRSSELFASITEEQKQAFFRLQGRRRVQDEYWAYDSTSISSYSECLSQVRHGKNKDDDRLPQINLLLLFGQKSNLPFYYRKLAGNIPDSSFLAILSRYLSRRFVQLYGGRGREHSRREDRAGVVTRPGRVGLSEGETNHRQGFLQQGKRERAVSEPYKVPDECQYLIVLREEGHRVSGGHHQGLVTLQRQIRPVHPQPDHRMGLRTGPPLQG